MLLLPVLQLDAQQVRELKIKPLAPLFFKNYQVEYEWIPQRRIGVAFKYRLDRFDASYLEYDPVNYGNRTVSFVERLNTFTAVAKYYMEPGTNGIGPFAGLYCLNQRYFRPSQVEQDYFKRTFNSDLPKDLRTSFGVVAGIKAIIKKTMVLEIEAGIGPNLYQVSVNGLLRESYKYNSAFTAFADFKIGVRIPEKRKSKKK